MSHATGSLLLVAALAGGGVAAPAWADPAEDDEAVELEPMEVRPGVDPLWADREHLRTLIDDQPCLGCDEQVRKALANAFADYVLAKAAVPDPTFEERRESRIQNEWRVSERGPEMDAFR